MASIYGTRKKLPFSPLNICTHMNLRDTKSDILALRCSLELVNGLINLSNLIFLVRSSETLWLIHINLYLVIKEGSLDIYLPNLWSHILHTRVYEAIEINSSLLCFVRFTFFSNKYIHFLLNMKKNKTCYYKIKYKVCFIYTIKIFTSFDPVFKNKKKSDIYMEIISRP